MTKSDTVCIVLAVQTFTDIINAWEKPAHLAEDIGEEVGTVRQWRNRDTFPDRVWKAAVEAAARRGIEGVTLERLAAIAARAHRAVAATTEAAREGEAAS